MPYLSINLQPVYLSGASKAVHDVEIQLKVYLFTGVYFVSQYLESLATRHVRTTTHRHAHTPGARRPPHHTQTQSSRAWQRSAAMCWSSTVL